MSVMGGENSMRLCSIVDVGDYTVDLTKVTHIGPVSDDSDMGCYTVYLLGGTTIQVYEKWRHTKYMARAYLVCWWIAVRSQS